MENRETFIAITGCSSDEVDQWFQLGDNNLDRSVEIYYNMSGIDTSKANSNDNNIISEQSQSSTPIDDEIRKPDEVKRERLLDNNTVYEMENYGIQSNVNNNFNPNTDHIRYKGNFNGAKKFSIKKNNLLIVNLQVENNINSMNLNRNIWNDELVISLIQNNYTFMQLYTNNKSCKQLATNYNILEFPSVIIINPLTGILIWKSNGTKILKEDFVSVISELDYETVNKDLYETIENLSIKKLIENYNPVNFEIKENDRIILKLQIGKEKIDFITSINFNLKDLALQFSKFLLDKFPEEDEFDVYYDYPQKHLINEIKSNLNNVPKLIDIEYTKIRFSVKFTNN
jgi:hypothetical protein